MKVIKDQYTSEELQDFWASRLSRSLTLFAQSVALRKLPVRITRQPYVDVPAFTDSQSISINHDRYKSVGTGESIRRLKGLTIHELSHVLYTPRNQSAMGKWLSSHNYMFTAFNILEDCRIENLMIVRMSGVEPWLVNVVVTEILNKETLSIAERNEHFAKSYPLLYGRKYLAPKIIVQARNEFAKHWPHLVDKLHAIVDKYLVLTYHNKDDLTTAQDLVSEFYDILSEMSPGQIDTHNPHGKGSREGATPSSSGGQKPLGKRETEKDVNKVKDLMGKQRDEVKKATADDDTASDSTSTDDSADGKSSADKLADELKQQQSSSQERISEDVKNTLEQAKSSSGGSSGSSSKAWSIRPIQRNNLTAFAPSDVAKANMRKFAKHLLEVKALSDPYWEKRTDNGRLNVRNLMLERNIEEAFDLWNDEMSEATDVEAVVLVDDSASMYNSRETTAETVWAIKRAFDTIEANTTVINYGSTQYNAVQVYGRNESAGVKVNLENRNLGGTEPAPVLAKAQEILNNSPRAIKIMLILTDGLWEGETAAESTIISMRQSGILTGLAFIHADGAFSKDQVSYLMAKDENGNPAIDGHYCEVVTDVTDPHKLVNFAKSLADLSRAKLYNK